MLGTQHHGLILQILHVPACCPLNRAGRTEKHVAGDTSSSGRAQDAAETRAVQLAGLQRNRVSWQLTSTGDGGNVWDPYQRNSVPALMLHHTHKGCGVTGTTLPVVGSTAWCHRARSLQPARLPFSSPGMFLCLLLHPSHTHQTSDFTFALSIWHIYSTKNHRQDRANLCSGITGSKISELFRSPAARELQALLFRPGSLKSHSRYQALSH